MKPTLVNEWINGDQIRQQAFNRCMHSMRQQGLLVDDVDVLRVAIGPDGATLIAQTKSFGTIARKLC